VTRGATVARAAALFVVAGAAASSAQDAPAPAKRYGATPEELLPHRQAGEPYRRLFQEPPVFRGPGRELPEPQGLDAVRVGVLAPLTGEDAALGARMQEGVALAIDEANAAGGLRPGLPFRTVVRDENLSWGAAGNAAVDLAFDDGVWAFLGAFEDSASHVMTRVILKLETPMVNTAGTDPTLTEHGIPWLVRVRPDDRQTCYALARRIVETDRHERIAVFRANDRYARAGIVEFNDAVRRLGHPVLLEERFESQDASWHSQIERLRGVRPDAIVVWGRAATAGRAVRALRAAGLTQPVYGPERLADPAFAEAAGDAADGAVFTYPYDPRRSDPAWVSFVARYRARYGRDPDPVASYAYDGTRYLVQAIREAGLNRVRIRERLFAHDTADFVTGPARFDTTHNNVVPSLFGHVEHGKTVLE
jgi:branched-chain amino acid transport system substrate-binding protein